MSRSRRHPPASAEHVVGELFEFAPADDQVMHPPATPVELTPVGTAGPAFEFEPGDDKAARRDPRDTPTDQGAPPG